MTPEKRVKEKAKKVLEELKAYYFFPATGYGGRKGVPDIIACYDGKFVGIECKAKNNKPTKLQQKELDRIKKAGGIGIVFSDNTTTQELKNLLQNITEDKTHWALQNIS
jgi:hypothetical protein